jgi:hypothetical protein
MEASDEIRRLFLLNYLGELQAKSVVTIVSV